MLALWANAEALKQDHEDEQVIDAEGSFDGVAGDEFQGWLVALRNGDPAGKGGRGEDQKSGAEPGEKLRVAGWAAVSGEEPIPHKQQHDHNVEPYPPNPGDARDHSWMLQHEGRLAGRRA